MLAVVYIQSAYLQISFFHPRVFTSASFSSLASHQNAEISLMCILFARNQQPLCYFYPCVLQRCHTELRRYSHQP